MYCFAAYYFYYSFIIRTSLDNTNCINHYLDEMSCLAPDSTSNYRVEHFMKFFNFPKMVLFVKMVSSLSKTCEYYQNNKIPRASDFLSNVVYYSRIMTIHTKVGSKQLIEFKRLRKVFTFPKFSECNPRYYKNVSISTFFNSDKCNLSKRAPN